MALQLSSNLSEGDHPLFALKNVMKAYGSVEALRIDSLELHKGDRIVVVGANASGKSTLLRLLAGITYPTRGKVIQSDDVGNMHLGYVPQSGGINLDLTVIENIRVMERLYEKKSRPSLESWNVVELFGLGSYLHIPVSDLSGGYKRIAGLVAVLNLEPQILLLDEPLSGIDDDHGEKIRNLIGEWAEIIDLLVITDHISGDAFNCNRRIDLTRGSEI
jgi:ABC-2 type transport system ATP-binding protein